MFFGLSKVFILGCIFFLFFVLSCIIVIYHSFMWRFINSLVSRVWVSSFECGFLSGRIAENVFSYTYFILLVFFVIFDLEVSLLLKIPYQGVLYRKFIFYFVFLLILSIGYFVEVSKGYAS